MAANPIVKPVGIEFEVAGASQVSATESIGSPFGGNKHVILLDMHPIEPVCASGGEQDFEYAGGRRTLKGDQAVVQREDLVDEWPDVN